MSDDTLNEGRSEDEEEDESRQEGLFAGVRRWLTGEPKPCEEDASDGLDETIEAAHRRVDEYYASGKADEHKLQIGDPSYRATLAYRISSETEHLERHLAHYDEACQQFGPNALLDQELWAKRIAGLSQAVEDAEREAAGLERSYDNLEERWQNGAMSRAEYDDLFRKLGRKEQRTGTRMEMSGLGGGYEEIGDVGDQAGHIIVDGLSDDGGAARQQIAKKLRSMPRRMALEILQQAVADGVISIETARYLERECVRPS